MKPQQCIRIGIGTDLHRLKKGNGFRLGGIDIPCDFGVEAVSDGDVLLHALVDALLGACAMGDIGDYFPESKVLPGEDSRRFLAKILDVISTKMTQIINVDCIIDLEKPRLAANKTRIAQNIAGLLCIQPDRVNVKAKTSERLGPVGENLAVAAQVAVLLALKEAGGD